MIRKISFLLAILLLVSHVSADDQSEQALRSKQLMDRAGELSRVKNTSGTQVVPGPMPSRAQMNDALDKAGDAASHKSISTSDLVDRAYVRHTEGLPQLNTAASTAASASRSNTLAPIDPAEIAKLYTTPAMKGEINGPKDELLVFVSTSIPAETLKVIGAQAKRTGAVLVLRGVAGGFSNANLRHTLFLMKPAIAEGADVQINPELFRRYDVNVVPTTVLSSAAGKGCDEGFCNQHVELVGDVTIEYALEEFARRSDALGRLAEKRLGKLRGEPE